MLKLLRLFVVLGAAALALLVTSPVANAQPVTTLVAPLSPEPTCPEAEASGATGFAVVTINEASGRITYRVVAFNLPGTFTVAHIHGPVPPEGGNAPPFVDLFLPGLTSGFFATGTTTVDPARAEAIADDPGSFYVNVHTTTCPGGAIRGTLTPA